MTAWSETRTDKVQLVSAASENVHKSTLANQVVDFVRAWIAEGVLEPGQLYSVHQVAQWLSISRSPVREGLLRLEEAGVVKFVKNRGFTVIEVSAAEIAEMYLIRLALEVPASIRSVRFRDQIVPHLLEIQSKTVTAIKEQREDRFIALDLALHTTILSAGGRTWVARVANELREPARSLSVGVTRFSRSMCDVYGDHQAIVEAIVEGDARRTGLEMQNHLLITAKLLFERALKREGTLDASDEIWSELSEGYQFLQ